MRVQFKKGIDNIIFGMSRLDVELVLGKPDREFIDLYNENELISEYTDLKLRITFYLNEGERLGYIRCSHANLKLNGINIIDTKIQEIQEQINANEESWEIVSYDSFSTYFLESVWITLLTEYERVTVIELGAPFKSDDKYDWPV